MIDPTITRPFPIFRIIVMIVMIIVSRILKWIIPGFSAIVVLVWLIRIPPHLQHGIPLKVEGGDILTLAEALTSMGQWAATGIICFFVGEALIRLNERFTRSIAVYMGEDPDKI